MKQYNQFKLFIILLVLPGMAVVKSNAQDSAAAKTVLGINYFLPENKIPYFIISTKKKVGRKFEPVKGIALNFYFSEASEKNLIGKLITGITGEGRIALPPTFKETWDSLNELKFVAISDSSSGVEPLTADLTIKKAILVIDTASIEGVRTMTAQLREKKGIEWVPVNEIEMYLGIKRMGGNLSVGDKETYTSDSTGVASAEFQRDSIPGDERGNLILVARVVDNDTYGNLVAERSVSWGRPVEADTNFWHRSLWSTGNRAPLWLVFTVLFIITGVWGVMIYLIRQLAKIKKMGREYDRNLSV